MRADAALGADICRNAFQRHYSRSSCVFCNACVLRGDDIHNNAAFKHLCQAFLTVKEPVSAVI